MKRNCFSQQATLEPWQCSYSTAGRYGLHCCRFWALCKCEPLYIFCLTWKSLHSKNVVLVIKKKITWKEVRERKERKRKRISCPLGHAKWLLKTSCSLACSMPGVRSFTGTCHISTWVILWCFPRCVSSRIDWKWSSKDWSQCLHELLAQ